MATISKIKVKGVEYDLMPAQFELKDHKLTITDSDGYSVTIPLSKPTTGTTESTGSTGSTTGTDSSSSTTDTSTTTPAP